MEVVSGWEELLSCSHGDPQGSRCLRERERVERMRLREREVEIAMEARVREIWGGQSRLDQEQRRESGFGRMTEREGLDEREINGVKFNSLLLRDMCNAHDQGQVSTLPL